MPEGIGAEMRGEPGWVQIERWCGVLDYHAIKPTQQSLCTGDMFGIVVFIIGDIKRVLLPIETWDLRRIRQSFATPTTLPSHLFRFLVKASVDVM